MQNKEKKQSKWRTKTLKQKVLTVLKWSGISLLIFIIVGFFGIWLILKDSTIDKVELQKILDTKQTVIFYDDNDEVLTGVYSVENRVNVKLSEVPKYVQQAFISIEDARFYEHSGIDIRRIIGSLIEDIKAGAYVEGASTIPQQLIKLSHLSGEKKLSRKLKEAYMAIQLENMCSKDEILEMYLNYVYFGNGAYGIEAASNVYFGKSCSELTLAEGALLAGVVNSPSNYAPHINPEASIERRDLVLAQMSKYGYIDDEEKVLAQQEKLTLSLSESNVYPYGFFIDSAISEACAELNISLTDLLTSGYHIYTSMDRQLQGKCENELANDAYFPDTLENGEDAECAIVVQDVKTGAVKAIVGGREYTVNGALNRANQVKRQPGSSIKPILVYGPALEINAIAPVTPLLDQPVNINGYSPKNYNNQYKGWVTARESLALSLNCPTVELLNSVGVERAKSYAESCGIEFDADDTHLALALGGMKYGVTPLELCNAYQSIANSGKYIKSSYIRRICNANGDVIWSAEPQSRNTFSHETSYLLTDMMRSAVTDGTAKALNALDIDVAAKTGTVGADKGSGNKDIWVAAYTSEYAVCVWAGYDKQSNSLTGDFSASGTCTELAREIFAEIYTNRKPNTFYMPSGITSVKLDLRSLKTEHKVELAGNYTPKEYIVTELFNKGFEPKTVSDYWNIPQTPTDFTVIVNNDGMPRVLFTSLQSHTVYQIVREHNGVSVVIKEIISPKDTLVEYTDTSTVGGEIYEYYIIPVHSEAKVNNRFLQGKPTNKISVMSVVPYSSPSLTPEQTPLPEASGPPDVWEFFG